MKSLVSPLRSRDFRLLLAGQSISWIGNNFYEIAIMWLVLSLTGSTAAMAGVAAVSTIPQLVFAPFAGVLADRVNRRLLALSMDLCRGVIILILPTLAVLHHLAAWQVYVVAFMLFTLFTFFIPSRQAILPNVVSNEDLPAANGLFQAVLSVSLLLGFALGGLVVAWVGVVPALYLDALSFGASVVSLLFMRTSGRAANQPVSSGERRSPFGDVAEGLRFLRGQPSLLAIFGFIGAISFLVGPLLILSAPFSRNVLHSGVQGYGFLEASMMVGNLGGALVGTMAKRVRPIGLLLIGVVVVAGVLLFSISFVTLLVPAMLIYLSIGFASGTVNVPLTTLIQRLTPDAIRGRVMSTLMMINTAGIPLSLAAGGLLAQRLGVTPMYQIVGALFVLTGFLALLTPLVRVKSDDAEDGVPAAETSAVELPMVVGAD